MIEVTRMKYARLLFLLIASTFLITATLMLTACKNNEEPDAEPTPPPAEKESIIELEVFSFTPENFPRMNGSPATLPLAQALWSALLGESEINTEDIAGFTRTTQSYRDLAAGLNDILIAGEPIPGVFDEISELGFEIDIAPIAVDALVFITSASNPVDDLTPEQIRLIYMGEISNWQQVGGENKEIIAFQRNEEAGSQVLMEKLVMDWRKMMDAPVQDLSVHDTDEPMTAIMGFDGSENAIAYTMLHYAENMKMADGFKILSINGVQPDADTIAGGAYPFINPYYAAINASEPEDNPARILFNWLQSEQGRALVEHEGYVVIGN